MSTFRACALAAMAAIPFSGLAQAQTQTPTTFFVTSVGLGKGGDLGGLDGADRHCQTLAAAAGAASRTWRAYLSTQGPGAVNARDRIGAGPWVNAKGEVIAKSVADLHGGSNAVAKQTALNEKGGLVNGRGDTPNMHEASQPTQGGTAFPAGDDATCSNWTSSAEGQGGAVVGHHDLIGNAPGGRRNCWDLAPGPAVARTCNLAARPLLCFASN